jgi:hypothetical protein
MNWRWLVLLWCICFRAGLVVATAAALSACVPWLYRPEGPTDQAVKAGTTELSKEIDLNHDGVISTEEVAWAAKQAAANRDWETLIWLLIGVAGGGASIGTMAHMRGEKKGFRRGLFTPVPEKAG